MSMLTLYKRPLPRISRKTLCLSLLLCGSSKLGTRFLPTLQKLTITTFLGTSLRLIFIFIRARTQESSASRTFGNLTREQSSLRIRDITSRTFESPTRQQSSFRIRNNTCRMVSYDERAVRRGVCDNSSLLPLFSPRRGNEIARFLAGK
jgi:hypothetical protein